MSAGSFDLYSADLDKAGVTKRSPAALANLHSRMVEGDKEAHEILWLHGTKLVLKIANKLKEEDLLRMSFEDAVAEGNLAIGEALSRWEPRKSAFSTWVWIRIRGGILNENAKHDKEFMTGEPENLDMVPELIDGELGRQAVIDLYLSTPHEEDPYRGLYAHLEGLPDREKDYLFRAYFLDMTHAEIAREDGIARPTVTAVITRALQRLKNSFAE